MFADFSAFNAFHTRQAGYNLTSNVSGVCPECGKVIEQADGDVEPDGPHG